MYPLFETICILDGQPQHLPFHQARLERAWLALYREPAPFLIEKVLSVPVDYRRGRVKCRFSYGREGLHAGFAHYRPKEIRCLMLVAGQTIEYSHKYTDRSRLEQLLARSGKCNEILIVKNGRITDTSYTNIVFYDGQQWVTPDQPLLRGTARERLLTGGVITPGEIRVEDLSRYESFRLINAMLNFRDQPALSVSKNILG